MEWCAVWCTTLRHSPPTATHCSTLQHTLQHTAAHCNTPQTWVREQTYVLMHCCSALSVLQSFATRTATHCNHEFANRHIHLGIVTVCWVCCSLVQQTAPHCNNNNNHCNTLQHTATHYKHEFANIQIYSWFVAVCWGSCSALQHTATHCKTLKHTATHCNTLQQHPSNMSSRTNIYTHASYESWVILFIFICLGEKRGEARETRKKHLQKKKSNRSKRLLVANRFEGAPNCRKTGTNLRASDWMFHV